MSIPTTLRPVVALALLAAAVAPGCHARTSPEPASMTLSVQNSSEFQVNVYAAPSAPTSRFRLGSVAPLSSSQLALPQSALGSGGVLRVVVDPIGSTTQWVSPTVNVGADTRPCLRVLSDADGSLGRSSLYTQLGAGSGTCP